MKNGVDSHTITRTNGNRKKRCPKMSIQSRPRFDSRLETMSMRMCSFAASVHAAQSMNTAPNRYHCSSSQALEEVPNTLRMMALTADTTTATTIAQAVILPICSFNQSMKRLTPRSGDTSPDPLLPSPPCYRAGAGCA
jgi:hypothetical protein